MVPPYSTTNLHTIAHLGGGWFLILGALSIFMFVAGMGVATAMARPARHEQVAALHVVSNSNHFPTTPRLKHHL